MDVPDDEKGIEKEYFQVLNATDALIDQLSDAYPKEKMHQCINELRTIKPSHITIGYAKDMYATTKKKVEKEWGDVLN